MNFSRWLPAVVVVSVVSCGPGKTMQVNNKPTADFKITKSTVRPQVFAFDGALSTTTVGTISTYKWLFGDEATGAMPTSLMAPATSHAYKAAGMFQVTLVVADDKGVESDPVTKSVEVLSINTNGPMAVLTGDAQGQPGTQLTFHGENSTPIGDIQNFEWDFGDNSAKVSGKDKTITQHAFSAAGRYTVKLTVTDSLGANATATLQVGIGDTGPLAVCSFMPATGVTIGSPVMFTGAMSTVPQGSNIVSYIWDFGDGVNNVPGAMPGGTAQHAFNMMGTFRPKLTVYDNSMPRKSSEAFCPDVTVGAAPLCNYSYTWTSTGGSCQFVSTTIDVIMNANGTITFTEPTPSGPMAYTGTWTGNTFRTTFDDGVQTVTFNGSFAGCDSFTATYVVDVLGVTCTESTRGTKN